MHEARQHVRHMLQGGGSSAAGLSHGAPTSAADGTGLSLPNILASSQISDRFRKNGHSGPSY